MEVEKEVVLIDDKNYDNVLQMLNSKDPESVTLGLTLINNCDIANSLGYIMLMKRNGSEARSDMWKEHVPKVATYMKDNGINPDSSMSYKDILTVVSDKNLPKDVQEFIKKALEADIISNINSIGYDFIEEIKVTININGNG